jgi:hypothetical protein
MSAMTNQQLSEAPAGSQLPTAHDAGAPDRTQASRRSEPLLERGSLVFLGTSLALVGACLPFARALDAQIDRQRPMYSDVRDMAWLQQLNLSTGGDVIPLSLSHRSSAHVGDTTFAPTSGVSIEVRRDGDGYCVIGANQYGDTTRWQCYYATNLPLQP